MIRASDICGRLGGDEFLLVITHVEAESIYKGRWNASAKSLRRRKISNWRMNKFSITASFGIAGFHGKEILDFSTLIRRADKALYAGEALGPEHR